ncbi:DUF1624 domain-containing protein [Prolixibacteraceae bacterium JC049]|nr:DUF1624 domain-containing protein [Prolixibacteraceae bacterium JC049]
MNYLKRLFNPEKVNTGRQLELDIARALAVVFMVFVHVQMTFSNEELAESFFGAVVDFMGGIPAAPVFMFLMGVGFLYSSKSAYQLFIKRGILILLLGYCLNLLRDVIPELIDFIVSGEEEALGSAIEGFIDVDILQFAGVAMIFWGLVKKFRLNNYAIALLGILFPFLNMVLLNIQFENYVWQAITGLFWGSSKYSEFPFFTWIAYPILGYLFANLLVRCNDKGKFYRLIISTSIPSLIISFWLFGFVLNQPLGMESELNYYHHNGFANIVYGLFCLFWISLIFFISNALPQVMVGALKRWSKNVTSIYFIHWVIIGWLSAIFYDSSVGLTLFLVVTLGVFALSDWLAYKHSQYRQKIKSSN